MSNMKDKRKEENYSVFLKHIEEDKEETSKFAKTLLILVLFLIILVGAFLFFLNDEKTIEELFGKDNVISNMLIDFVESKAHRRRAEFSIPFLPHRQNILLLGVDSNGSKTDPWTGTRSDTIVVLNIDPKTRSINAISIPRDSKVYLPGEFGVQKINAAHALGGIRMVRQTVEETLGIKIDRYIIVSDDAVRKLVDALGGVPIYVEKRMNYDDYSGDLHVHLQKGLNILDGRNAVGYLRFRHDGMGDIGRTQRQQWFLRGLLEKIQSPQAIAKIPAMLNIATTYVKTDLSLYEMSQYAALAKSFDISRIEVATLPGGPNKKGSTSYWILDPDKTQEVVNRLIYRDQPSIGDKKFVAGIMYSPEKERDAMKLKSELQELGFEVNCTGRGHLPHSQFVANTSSVSGDFFNWLKKKVPEIKHNQFVYDPNKFYCVDSDFVVIMSGQ
ncbi:MAG: LCP family protein [Candidatus Gastranaerophilaceae bacterium]